MERVLNAGALTRVDEPVKFSGRGQRVDLYPCCLSGGSQGKGGSFSLDWFRPADSRSCLLLFVEICSYFSLGRGGVSKRIGGLSSPCLVSFFRNSYHTFPRLRLPFYVERAAGSCIRRPSSSGGRGGTTRRWIVPHPCRATAFELNGAKGGTEFRYFLIFGRIYKPI